MYAFKHEMTHMDDLFGANSDDGRRPVLPSAKGERLGLAVLERVEVVFVRHDAQQTQKVYRRTATVKAVSGCTSHDKVDWHEETGAAVELAVPVTQTMRNAMMLFDLARSAQGRLDKTYKIVGGNCDSRMTLQHCQRKNDCHEAQSLTWTACAEDVGCVRSRSFCGKYRIRERS